MKVIILLVVCLLIVSSILLLNNDNINEESDYEDIYQGPIPQGYDLEHFRNTGETIKEVNV